MMMPERSIPLVVRRVIHCPRERVFAAFQDAEALGQWFTPSTDVSIEVLAFNFREKGRFRFCYSPPGGSRLIVGGTYEVIVPPAKIAMTWIWETPAALAGVLMRVTFAFYSEGAATEVVITHEGIPSNQSCIVQEDGWAATIARLERHLNHLGTHVAACAGNPPRNLA